ncbi:DUF4831 family protein [Bacteroides propionicifaciens]|jgi:hypothetical protein|uniref:DUF4831 family protein n=1 Tax=Bacteroides propionicifaciens TaxID=392838 RepID=UPI000366677A|nr:DUF4831 family protein [Bacteroides propionicifaciens]
MLKKSLIIGAILLSSLTLAAQTKVTTGVMRGKEYGVTYTLPKTKIELTLTANNKRYTPGEFAKYASTYLHIEGVQLQPKNYWELDKVAISSIGVPDPDKIFFVEMKDKTVAPFLSLTKDGLIEAINVPYGSKEVRTEPKASSEKALPNPRNYFTEEILVASSTAKMAELVAKEIYSIRESRNSLLRGEAENTPQDGNQLKLMLDNLAIQEESLLTLFKGQTTMSSQEFTVDIEPKADIVDSVICRFSTQLGVIESDDLAGEPIYLSLKDLRTVNLPPVDNKKKTTGIAYNVPGKANVTIKYNGNIITQGDLPVTQFGSLEYLAPALFNKKSKVQAIFNPTTGGLIKVSQQDL